MKIKIEKYSDRKSKNVMTLEGQDRLNIRGILRLPGIAAILFLHFPDLYLAFQLLLRSISGPCDPKHRLDHGRAGNILFHYGRYHGIYFRVLYSGCSVSDLKSQPSF